MVMVMTVAIDPARASLRVMWANAMTTAMTTMHEIEMVMNCPVERGTGTEHGMNGAIGTEQVAEATIHGLNGAEATLQFQDQESTDWIQVNRGSRKRAK